MHSFGEENLNSSLSQSHTNPQSPINGLTPLSRDETVAEVESNNLFGALESTEQEDLSVFYPDINFDDINPEEDYQTPNQIAAQKMFDFFYALQKERIEKSVERVDNEIVDMFVSTVDGLVYGTKMHSCFRAVSAAFRWLYDLDSDEYEAVRHYEEKAKFTQGPTFTLIRAKIHEAERKNAD
jgi:hypothetical protein